MFVRVNPAGSGEMDRDLEAIGGSGPAGLVLPKAEGAASVQDLLRRAQDSGLPAARVLPIATETAAAVFRLAEFAAVAQHLLGLTWGAEDLTAAVGAATAREPDGSFTAPYEFVRSLTLFAAHAARVPAIETVFPAFRDLDGAARYAGRGARDGFTGMMAIHPAQVKHINAAFTPTPAAVAHARRIVEEFRRQPDAGVVSIDGAMIDAPHLKQARSILERAQAADREESP
jgi:citrate lyase subunit beta/citryl-CoA lyase